MAKIKLKSNYYKQFKNRTISREENNRLKNRLNKEINRDKDKYYQTIFGNSKGNMKKSWNTLSSLLGTPKNKSLTDKIFGDAITDTDKMRIVKEFNNFFAGIGNTLAAQMPDSINPPSFPSDHLQHSFFLFPPKHDEVSKL